VTEDTRLLTTDEASRYLGLRSQLLVQWRYDGKGPAFHRLGRLVRYDVFELDAWLEDQKVAPSA
jgi:excisionase family DNA binding protein